MSKGCRDGFCFAGHARRGGAWGRGQGTEYVLTLYFHLRKIGRVSVKIHLYPYSTPDYLCDLNSVKFVQYKDYNSLLILGKGRRSVLSFVLLASSETLYQNPNLFLNILNQNYQVRLNLLSSNCQIPPTDSNENSQNRI